MQCGLGCSAEELGCDDAGLGLDGDGCPTLCECVNTPQVQCPDSNDPNNVFIDYGFPEDCAWISQQCVDYGLTSFSDGSNGMQCVNEFFSGHSPTSISPAADVDAS